MDVELKALEMSLICAKDWNLKLANVCTECLSVVQAITQEGFDNIWGNIELINDVKQLIFEL